MSEYLIFSRLRLDFWTQGSLGYMAWLKTEAVLINHIVFVWVKSMEIIEQISAAIEPSFGKLGSVGWSSVRGIYVRFTLYFSNLWLRRGVAEASFI